MKQYLDSDVGNYKRIFPLAKYSFPIDLSQKENVKKSLKENIWFTNSNPNQRNLIIQKLQSHNKIIEKLLKIINNRTKNNIRHISIGGSYLFNNHKDRFDRPHDIDYNVLVSGSYFDYFNLYKINFIKNAVLGSEKIKKISFMIFGEDNIFKGSAVDDSIESEGYVHTDVTTREGLVFSWRNGTIYGKSFGYLKINRYNLLIRIARQLYQAKLYLQNKIGLKRTLHDRQRKALNRIIEAAILLNKAFPKINISSRNNYSYSEILNKKLISPENVWFQYKEILDYYNKVYRFYLYTN